MDVTYKIEPVGWHVELLAVDKCLELLIIECVSVLELAIVFVVLLNSNVCEVDVPLVYRVEREFL